MSSTLISRERTVSGRYSDMEQTDFKTEFETTWTALNEVKTVLETHVQKGNLSPLDAIRGFAALTANILGYEEFVPRGNPMPLISSQ